MIKLIPLNISEEGNIAIYFTALGIEDACLHLKKMKICSMGFFNVFIAYFISLQIPQKQGLFVLLNKQLHF